MSPNSGKTCGTSGDISTDPDALFNRKWVQKKRNRTGVHSGPVPVVTEEIFRRYFFSGVRQNIFISKIFQSEII